MTIISEQHMLTVSLNWGCKILRKDLLVSNSEETVTSLNNGVCIHRHKHTQQVYPCFICSLSESVSNAQVAKYIKTGGI
jgi:hypothetical protein